MNAVVVNALRDAAEDHRVDPSGRTVTIHLDSGSSVTGRVLAVEDGAAYVQPAGAEGPAVIDLREIVRAG
ncbi:hypothetical protein [Kineococcus glutinatus]|uniref:Uncharacterized protein n=1 Tax=Kineococcus glutinatus TaxID=1070872 RepID=A0ABP9H7Z8_9ACTN